MKKSTLYIIDFCLIIAAVALTFNLYVVEYKNQKEKSLTAFDSSVYALEHVVVNYLDAAQNLCDLWANIINKGAYTIDDALYLIEKSNPDSPFSGASFLEERENKYIDYSFKEIKRKQEPDVRYDLNRLQDFDVQIIFLETDSGKSLKKNFVSNRVNNDFDENRYSFVNYGLGMQNNVISPGLIEACRNANNHSLRISRIFINPITNKKSLAFCNLVNIFDENGKAHECVLLRIESIFDLENRWFFPINFNSASVSIIDIDGDYIIKGTSFLDTNFYDYIKSVNHLSYEQKNEIRRNIITNDNGRFVYKDGRGNDCNFSYKGIAGNRQWNIVACISNLDLEQNQFNWIVICITIITFVLLILINGCYIMSVNIKLEKGILDVKKANAAKTSFLSSMSHDIRTPMNAIIGMTEIASRNIEDPVTIKESLHKISMASNLLLTLVNDVLDISKVESGKMSLNPTEFSFCDFVNNIVGIEYPLVREKNLDFEVRLIDIQKTFLYADSLRLNQIFINLLSNAIKYTEPGGEITVDIKQSVCPENENKVKLIYSVSDNGIGMSKDFMKQMFLPFSRATDTRISVIQGSGLGLAITKQMIDFMGGSINVESELGQGSKFEVSIDIDFSSKELVFDNSLEGKKVLFLDDDEIILDSTKKILDFFKVKSDCISDVKMAEKLIIEKIGTDEAYDIIIVDQTIRRTSAIDFVKALKAKVNENLPYILIATFNWSEIEKQAIEVGINSYISKPIFKCSLYRKLHEYLSDEEFACRIEESNDDVKGINVLIAEDNDLNWEIIHEILGFYDITSDRAENGKDCVDIINHVEDGKYDLIFMDIQMPKMNGLDATRAIRKSSSPYVRNIPVIAMTADAFSENVTECLEAGMNGHIAKPIDMKLVLKEIRRALFGLAQ